MNRYIIRMFSILVLTVASVSAQKSDSTQLTLERIFKHREFRADYSPRLRWTEDGTGYTTLEKSKETEGSKDIVLHEPASGKTEVLIPANKLLSPETGEPFKIQNYRWSPDREYLLIFTNAKRVWRYKTRGDYWLLQLKSGKLHKLGGKARPSTLMFAKFSPDGKMVGYVCEHNVYVENVRSHKITQLTYDGSETLINGTFDWVYEEEFKLRNGFRWSPDSKLIAYWQLDASGVGEFLMINNTDSIYSRVIPVQYPKVGTTNSACRVGVVKVTGSETGWMAVPGDPRNNYIAFMEWAENSDEIVVQHINRLQNKNQVMLANAHTGEVKTVFTDQDSAWLDPVDDMIWLKNGREFLWVSEMDDWRHVYRISRSGTEKTLITSGEYDAMRIMHVDQENDWLYFMASPENATQLYLYRTRLNGRGQAERLTPAEQSGIHKYHISSNSKWAQHTYTTFDRPPIQEIISLPDHRPLRTLVSNEKLQAKLNQEFITIERSEHRYEFGVELGRRKCYIIYEVLITEFLWQQRRLYGLGCYKIDVNDKIRYL